MSHFKTTALFAALSAFVLGRVSFAQVIYLSGQVPMRV
jgi:hypothetical protein